MEGSQKQVVVLLIVIAALLAGIAGVIIYQQNNNSVPAPVATSQLSQQPATDGGAAAGGGVAPAGGGEFDPATAPAVPTEMTPEEFVTEYYELTLAGSYDEAYVMLPTATQAYYGDSGGFANTLQGYGISGYSVDAPVEDGDTVTIVGHQEAQGMNFSYQWTLVKGDDGAWLVKSREMAGM
jgi:hypothetical protein